MFSLPSVYITNERQNIVSFCFKDPQSAIPKGTLLAIVITGIVYLGVAFSAGRQYYTTITFLVITCILLSSLILWILAVFVLDLLLCI